MDAGTLSILSSYGEPFMETVCRDACDGHDVGRVSSVPFGVTVCLMMARFSSTCA